MSHLPGAVRVDPDSQHSLESLKIPSNSKGRSGCLVVLEILSRYELCSPATDIISAMPDLLSHTLIVCTPYEVFIYSVFCANEGA